MKETNDGVVPAILYEKLRNNSNEFKSRFMLDMLFGYFNEVAQYVCEKTFIGTAYWYPDIRGTKIQVDVTEMPEDFGEKVVAPWLNVWNQKHKRGAKAPYLKYLKNNVARIIIPLTEEERGVLRSTEKYEGELIKQKDKGWKEGDKL